MTMGDYGIVEILKKEYWELFKPDGKKFEELVGALIEHKYHEAAFVHTGQPGDGGKDFEGLFELPTGRTERLWAECKYHTPNLSLNDISTTLLMAFLKDVRELFIFSYSPINANLVAHLAEYEKVSRVDVKVFHDKSLEAWILEFCRDTNRTKDFFPALTLPVAPLCGNGEMRCEYRISHGQRYSTSTQTITASLSDILYLEINLFNDSSNATILEYEFDSSELQGIHFLEPALEKHTNIQVPAHGLHQISIPVKLATFSPNPQFPNLKLFVDGKLRVVSPCTSVECHWLAETPLCGSVAKKMVKEIIAGLSDQTFSTVSLEGSSGVGKSRLLLEIEQASIAQNRITIKLDTDQKSVTELVFLRRICTETEGLPFFAADSTKKSLLFGKDCHEGVRFAARLIYDNTISLPEHRDEIIRYLVDVLQRKPSLWLLDNVQRYDEEVIALLNGVLDYCVGQDFASKIIFTWNTDELFPEGDADCLRRRLKNLASKVPQHHSHHTITGFDTDAAMDYLRQCLTWQNDHSPSEVIRYERTLQSIVSHCGANPFWLQNYLLYLDQTKILRRTNYTCYYIHDVEEFQNTLHEIPPDPFALIHKREQHFLNSYPQYNEPYSALVTALVLSGGLSQSIILSMGIPLPLVDLLVEIGFLSIDQQSFVSCQHRFFNLYLKKQYPITALTGKNIEKFLTACNLICLHGELVIPRFLAQYLSDSVDPALFSDVLTAIQTYCVPVELGDECFRAVMKYLDKQQWYQTDPAMYADVISTIGNTVTRRQGLRAALPFFENIYEVCLHHPDLFRSCFPFSGLKEYLCHLLNVDHQEESLQKNKKLTRCIWTLGSEEATKKKRLVMLLNCQVMAHYQMEQLSYADSLNQTATKIAYEIEDIPLILDCLRGRGDLNYQSSRWVSHKPEIISSWRSAFKLYIETYGSNTEPAFQDHVKISTYLKGALAEMMAKNFGGMKVHTSFLRTCFNKTNMSFYEINLRFVYAAYLILSSQFFALDLDAKSKAIELLDQITDLNAVFGRQISNIHAFHLRGVAQLLSGESALAVDSYQKAATMLVSLANRPNYMLRYGGFWEDFALLLKEENMPFPDDILSALLPEQREEVRKIASLSHEALSAYHYNRPDPAPLCAYVEQKRWGLPMLI